MTKAGKRDRARLWARRFGAVIVSILATRGAAAQELPEDLTQLPLEQLMAIDLVYGASMHEQKVTEAPSFVSVITSSDIERYGYRTLADVLRSVHGFYTTYDRSYTYLGVRGFSRPSDYNTRFLLLLDGHRINDNFYGTAYVGTEEIIDVDLIDRVEIIRGPSSSLYGTSAFFAVINVVTKMPSGIPRLQVSAMGRQLRDARGTRHLGAAVRRRPVHSRLRVGVQQRRAVPVLQGVRRPAEQQRRVPEGRRRSLLPSLRHGLLPELHPPGGVQ